MVAEHVLRIPLADLQTIRIRCGKCGTITEGPCNSVNNRAIVTNQCGACSQRFPDSKNLFELVSQIEQLCQLDKSLSVEFVVRDPEK